MRYGDGMRYGSGMRYGASGLGVYYVSSGPFHYYTMDYVETMLPDPEIEKPVPPELAWTKMNTGWNKKRGRK